MISRSHLHAHEPVESHAEQLLLLVAHEFDDEQGNSVFGQRLPGFDVMHFGLNQIQVLDIGVRLQNALHQLKTQFP
jgi:hypothetical protein